ncbi:hypothetical protein J3R08_002509 [Micromonospora sp. HB375]|uniref:hypothetical protein n=1 Tax=unclassified Micromonospora TaxID=2617518 RepID=UPI001AE7ABA5|nr:MULTISPECIES: hypothetical protein [unclassified Micromonospora]MBP1782659.1 hypothetical protein [Micromonospora sp. HB375]MDH6468522.1 hypothetical protein [Micromonospora sp. H404/HB375]
MQLDEQSLVSGEPIGPWLDNMISAELFRYRLGADKAQLHYLVKRQMMEYTEGNRTYWHPEAIAEHHAEQASIAGEDYYSRKYPDRTKHYSALKYLKLEVARRVNAEVEKLGISTAEKESALKGYAQTQLEAWPNVNPMILRALADNRMRDSEREALLSHYRDGIPVKEIPNGASYISKGLKSLAMILEKPRWSDIEYSHLMMHRDHAIPGYVANASDYEQRLYAQLHKDCYGYEAEMFQYRYPLHVRRIGDAAPGASDLAPTLVGSFPPGLDILASGEVARDSLGEAESA